MAQPHQTDPAQAADLDQIAPAGAHGITVNPAGADFGAAAPLHGSVDAEHQRAVALVEVLDQKDSAGCEPPGVATTPHG